MKIVLSKIKIQINALICIMIFIWNVIFVSACQIYSAIVRSALAHRAVIWHLTQSEKHKNKKKFFKNFAVRMTSIQNKCLWIMFDVYYAILISVLKTEMFIFLLDLYLNVRLAQFWLRHKKSGMKNLIKNACLKICSKLCKRRCQLQHQSVQIEKKVRTQWAETWLKNKHQKNLSALKVLLNKWKQQ